MIVLDATVLIGYLDGEDAHHDRAEALLAATIDDDFGAQTMTLAEVLVVPAREGRLDGAREGRLDGARTVLEDVEVSELAFPPDSALKLAALRASTALKMPDCCVILAAEDAGARIATVDDRLGEAAAARGLTVIRG
ncbi:MAG: type II toxin-antitoxin system VapC family toxin [Dermatophilaceae bacterium]